MKRIPLLLLVLLASSTRWLQAEEVFPQKRSKSMVIDPPLERTELIAVPLDSQVYASARSDLSDLRVLADGTETVPFLVVWKQSLEPRVSRRSWGSGELAARRLDDGRFEISVSLDENDPQPTHMRIVTPLVNFEHQVDVYAVAKDGTQSRPLVEGAMIFDYSAVVDARRDTVSLPENSARHFRVEIRAMTDAIESPWLNLTRTLAGGQEVSRQERSRLQRRPLRIDRIEWIREKAHPQLRETVEVDWAVTMHDPVEDQENRRTLIGVSTHRQPVSKIELKTPSTNFSRRVRVEVKRDRRGRPEWQEVTSQTVHRFAWRDRTDEDLTVRLPETRVDSVRLAIENRDSPPLEVDSVEARGPVHELILTAVPQKSYQLLYDADVAAPDYDVAAHRQLLKDGAQPVAASLAGEVERTDHAEEPVSLRGVLNSPYVLGGAALILLVLLGWALYSASQRIDSNESV